MSKAIKGGQADRIKQLEQEIQNLKDVKKKKRFKKHIKKTQVKS